MIHPEQIPVLNEITTLKRRITELEEKNDQLQGQIDWCQYELEQYLRRNQ